MEEWDNSASLGTREAKETTSSPMGAVCSLKYEYYPASLQLITDNVFSLSKYDTLGRKNVASCSFVLISFFFSQLTGLVRVWTVTWSSLKQRRQPLAPSVSWQAHSHCWKMLLCLEWSLPQPPCVNGLPICSSAALLWLMSLQAASSPPVSWTFTSFAAVMAKLLISLS